MPSHVANINADFKGKDIMTTNQFVREDVDIVLDEADAMAEMVNAEGRSDLLDDLVVANLFYEASTRTFLSFEAAAKRLGALTIATQGVEYSSISKGETLEDTIRTVESYADTITLRHPEVGSAAAAAAVSEVPVINGGDGNGEHPTQALTDLHMIRSRLNDIYDLKVTMVGDLKNGRTVHSLARLLSLYGAEINYVSPKELAMPKSIVDEIAPLSEQYQTENLEDVIADTDVLYVTRVQKERFLPEGGLFKEIRARRAYDKLKDSYLIDKQVMKKAKEDCILAHPLPRVNEIATELDNDPRAAYFDQVKSGMYVRMGLLALINGRTITQQF
ncbi:aspartate carbamoyltransferase [bacterium]|nr:aspartate carbamoyltransferase [bacterium]